MGSSTKRQQTMAKMARERAVQEKRARKQEKNAEKKRLASERAQAIADGTYVADEPTEDEPGGA
jgi:hypothetical protein